MQIKSWANLLRNAFCVYVFPQGVRVLAASVFITNECNLNCIMCSIGRMKSKESMSLSKVDKIFKELKREGVMNIVLVGGEPTLHKNFKEIVEMAAAYGFSISMSTNGIFLNKIGKDTLKKFSEISVSLDSIKHYEQIRGKPFFEQVDKGIRRLKTLGIRTNVMMVVQKLNYNEIEDVIAYCKKLDLGLRLETVVITDLNPFVTSNKKIAYYDADSVIQRTKELSIKYPQTIINKTSFLSQLSQKKSSRCNSCVWPLRSIQVWVNGDLISCCGFYPKMLGNIFEKGLHKIRKDNMRYFISILNGKGACKDCSFYLTKKQYAISNISVFLKIPFDYVNSKIRNSQCKI